MISLILTCVGGLLTAGATTDGQRAIGSAVLVAGLSSALHKIEDRSKNAMA